MHSNVPKMKLHKIDPHKRQRCQPRHNVNLQDRLICNNPSRIYIRSTTTFKGSVYWSGKLSWTIKCQWFTATCLQSYGCLGCANLSFSPLRPGTGIKKNQTKQHSYILIPPLKSVQHLVNVCLPNHVPLLFSPFWSSKTHHLQKKLSYLF